jgi:hypothetical protein
MKRKTPMINFGVFSWGVRHLPIIEAYAIVTWGELRISKIYYNENANLLLLLSDSSIY